MLRTLLFGFLLISCVGLVVAETATEVDEGKSQLKIATYNIRYANPGDGKDVWPNRREAVIQYIGQNTIIGLQEVTKPQLDDLRKGLPQFESYGVGRDDGKSGGEHSPVFYRKDRFEVIDKGTFWLSESPEKVGVKGWDAALPRTCTWIHFRDRQSGQELYVANTHFDHRGVTARTESGKLIAQRLRQLPDDLPIVVMGDLNCPPDAEPYNAIASSFADARKVSDSMPTGPTSTWNGFSEIIPDRIIDHLFVRSINVSHLTTHNPKTSGDRFASDHLPVQAVVQLRRSGRSSSSSSRAPGPDLSR